MKKTIHLFMGILSVGMVLFSTGCKKVVDGLAAENYATVIADQVAQTVQVGHISATPQMVGTGLPSMQ
jgi:hypothetical protein